MNNPDTYATSRDQQAVMAALCMMAAIGAVIHFATRGEWMKEQCAADFRAKDGGEWVKRLVENDSGRERGRG